MNERLDVGRDAALIGMLKLSLVFFIVLVSLAACTIDAFDAAPPAQEYTRKLLRDRLDPDLNFNRGRAW